MTKLTKHQKKFWDYLKGESGIKGQRIPGNLGSVIKKMLDRSHVICDGRHGQDIFVINISKKRKNHVKEMQ